jgi:hypothetical protein
LLRDCFPTESIKLIEGQRSQLVSDISQDPATAGYLLIRAVCTDTDGVASGQRSREAVLEIATKFRALKYGLELAPGSNLLAGVLDRRQASLHLTEAEHRTRQAFYWLVNYVHARSACEMLRGHAYELAVPTDPHRLVLVDNPDWPGDAEIASNILEAELSLRRTSGSELPPGRSALVDYLSGLDLGGISSDQFLDAWQALSRIVHGDNLVPVVREKRDLKRSLRRATDLQQSEIETFINLITFDPSEERLYLEDTPLVHLTRQSVVAVPRLVRGVLISKSVMRLAKWKARGIGARLDQLLVRRLSRYYSNELRTLSEGPRYSSSRGARDVDIVAYDQPTNTLVLGQLKAFVPPGSALERWSAINELKDAIHQIEENREWFDSLGIRERQVSLSLAIDEQTRVLYTVLGNGYTGGDCIRTPQHVILCDVQYLLSPDVRTRPFVTALSDYSAAIRSSREYVQATVSPLTVPLGDVTLIIRGSDTARDVRR